MKRKCLIAFAMAGVLAMAQVNTAFAVPSIGGGMTIVGGGGGGSSSGGGGGSSSGGGGGSSSGGGGSSSSSGGGSSSSSSSTGPGVPGPGTVTIDDTQTPLASGVLAATMAGISTTAAATSVGADGGTVSVVTNGQTTAGLPVTANAQGAAVSGDMAFSFANGDAATAGLPAEVQAAINGINSGQPLDASVNSAMLEGYHALTSTHAIVATDPASGEVKTGNSEITLYVPNLVGGLQNVAILFYNNATGQWVVIPPIAINLEAKTVSFNLSGSGTLAVIYK